MWEVWYNNEYFEAFKTEKEAIQYAISANIWLDDENLDIIFDDEDEILEKNRQKRESMI